jgi:hypothetical protein
VGCASDRTRSDQEETWGAQGLTMSFVGGKHHLPDVRSRYLDAPRYVHVGDTHVDEHFAVLAGFEFVTVDEPHTAIATLTALLEATS